MNLNLIFDSYNFYRPSEQVERDVCEFIKGNIFEHFEAKTYTNSEEINEIITHMYSLYENIIESEIKKISQRTILEHLLKEYDKSHEIHKEIITKYRDDENILNAWQMYGPVIRRALKYQIEKCTINYQVKEIALSECYTSLDKVIIASEEMCKLYMSSEATYSVFSGFTTLTLTHDTSNYWVLKNTIAEAAIRPNIDFSKLSTRYSPPDSNLKLAQTILNDAFKQSFGVTLEEIEKFLKVLLFDVVTDQVPFVRKSMIVDNLVRYFNISTDNAKALLAGITISKEKLTTPKRLLYKPKQENRLFSRIFIEVPHRTGRHLVWAKGLATENLSLLTKNLYYRKIPIEWETKDIKIGMDILSNRLGKWFEKIAVLELEAIGVVGVSSAKKQIGVGKEKIEIPDNVGEIDYLGYSKKNNDLMLVEFKILTPSLEPTHFRDDYDKFFKENGYITKFQKKIEWVSQNLEVVCKCLSKQLKTDIIDPSLSKILITYYPSVMNVFVNEFTVTTLIEYTDSNSNVS